MKPTHAFAQALHFSILLDFFNGGPTMHWVGLCLLALCGPSVIMM